MKNYPRYTARYFYLQNHDVQCSINYIVETTHPTRIYPSQPLLGRSCQNKLMRSNNFDVNVPVTMCTEVESQANNCENKAYF